MNLTVAVNNFHSNIYLGYSELAKLEYDVDFDVNIQKSTYECKQIISANKLWIGENLNIGNGFEWAVFNQKYTKLKQMKSIWETVFKSNEYMLLNYGFVLPKGNSFIVFK